ncbi:right-handed parallel beta-helix repeat-containing protein [Kitasatospora gansuensis]
MGDNIKTRRGALAGAAILAALVAPVVGPGVAGAATADLYVNNAAGSNCTDAGSGLPTAPFCTVSAAAGKAEAGQTVHIATGRYDEQLKLTKSGTAGAPIRFVGADRVDAMGGVQIGKTDWKAGLHALWASGAQHVSFEGVEFTGSGAEAVLIENSSKISLLRGSVWGGGPSAPGIRIAGTSSDVRVAGMDFSYVGNSNVVVDAGVTGTVISTNRFFVNSSDSYPALVVLGSPNTVVVSNTVKSSCGNGIVLAGASTGAVVRNNVIDTSKNYPSGACPAGKDSTGLTVSAAAAPTADVDYNVISPVAGGPVYDWAGVAYRDQAAFHAASGDGTHDVVADPSIPYDGKTPQLSPIIDSADENAPGMLPLDSWGHEAKDDPVVPNTGTGSGIRDRGADEFLGFGSVFTPTGPVRLMDTREGVGVAKAPLKMGSSIDLQVAGVNGVPATGVTAVTLNVTVTAPTKGSYLTVYPHGAEYPEGATRPTASSINWVAGQTIPNQVTVPVIDGKVSFYAGGEGGTVEVLADLAGYYSEKGSPFTSAARSG